MKFNCSENKMSISCICRFLCFVFCSFLVILLFFFLGGYFHVHFNKMYDNTT